MNILSLKENCFFVGRAATAIFLILKSENMENKAILYPANVCYAAIYPALYAGCLPVFCDVCVDDGNVTYKEICKYIDQVSAIVIPHMYGNPVKDIEKIRVLCKEKDVLFIEDCASAMGAELPEGLCGSFGDYSIFSTGYSKTIDIGNGGFLLTNRSIKKMNDIYEQLPMWNQQTEENESFFSKLYRLIRNNKKQNLDQYIWDGLRNNLRDVFLYRYPEIGSEIKEAICGLSETVNLRRRKMALYQKLIQENDILRIYKFHDGAVPWRFNLLVSEDFKQYFIDELLKQKVPVSDWYPSVTPIFGNQGNYKNTKIMENQIVNFPLLIDDDEIKRICDCINRIANREKR